MRKALDILAQKRLLGDEPRKSAEPIALQAGVNVRNLQYFVGQSPWPIETAFEQGEDEIGLDHYTRRAVGWDGITI